MKRVCHMTSVHRRYDVRIFEKECRSSSNHGFETFLIVNDVNNNETKHGVNIISSGSVFSSRIKRIVYSLNYFYKVAKDINADIYHLHDPELLPLAVKLKNKNKKVIFDSHEFYSEQIREKEYLPKVIRKFLAYFYSKYEKHVFKKIDSIVYPCTLSNGKLPKKDIANKVVFLNNVPKLEEFYDRYEDRKFSGEIKLCHVGTLTSDRGVILTIKAAYAANVKLTLAGNFSPQCLYEDVIKLKEFETVDYRGYVSRNNVINIYKECNVGINVLLDKGQYLITDNLSTKIYEYMAMGLPVIMTETRYNKLILKEYPFGITVAPGSAEEIIDAVKFLAANPDKIYEMSYYGRKAIRERFNWELEEIKLIRLYNKLINY